jgi:hypothetical protein
MMNTKTNEIYGHDPVVNANDIRVHVLNIDSRYRDSVLEPATNFHWTLPSPLRNCIRARITSVELPNTWLAFTKKRGNVSFTIQALDSVGINQTGVLAIPNGNYDISGMLAAIQTALDDWAATVGIFFEVQYTPETGIFTWKFLGTGAGSPTNPPTAPFEINFNAIGNPISKSRGVLGLGFYLGFAQPSYSVSTTDGSGNIVLTGNCPVNLLVDPYVMLAIRDLNVITSKTAENYFDAFAKIPVKAPKGECSFLSYQDLVGYEFTATGPTDLKILLVQLLDRNGDLIDNCIDFSFSLEILEVMNLTLHDHYRNYTWLGQVPRIGAGARGSAVAGYLPIF